jgi:hypothetical protein
MKGLSDLEHMDFFMTILFSLFFILVIISHVKNKNKPFNQLETIRIEQTDSTDLLTDTVTYYITPKNIIVK